MTTWEPGVKPLGRPAYGSIPHLPSSRLGPGEHTISPGQDAIMTSKLRDILDVVVVQEKLDGSCVAAARVNGEIIALGRAGFLATSSSYPMHHMWARWVRANERRFERALHEGEWLVGEWLAQAHGTQYALRHEPFVAFDLMREMPGVPTRATYLEFLDRAAAGAFVTPALLHFGRAPLPLIDALGRLGDFGHHGALDLPEGVVYRVERKSKVDFLAKWVRPDKVDGCYLPSVCGSSTWNWKETAPEMPF